MMALFHDVEMEIEVYFHVDVIERTIGGMGPPLGLTHVFPSGRQVPLRFVKVEDRQAIYTQYESGNGKIEREKREDMARAKKTTQKATETQTQTPKGMPLNAAVAMAQAPAPALAPKADPPKYLDMDTADELWELDFPEKPELFRQLVQQRLDLKYEVDALEERIKEINGSLLPFFERNNMPGVKLENGALVRRHEGQSATLDKAALVLAGVPVDVIEKCTVRKKFVTVMVRGPKEG